MSFEKNVFLNCSFDSEKKPMLRAIIFAVLYLDIEPKRSFTTSSANIRILVSYPLSGICKNLIELLQYQSMI